MGLEEFIETHGEHDIIICDEGPTWPDDLRRRFGKDAAVDYLGEESPHYLENDGLYFIIRPPTKKGTPRQTRRHARRGLCPIGVRIRTITWHDNKPYQAS